MLARQRGLCAICKKSGRPLLLDHCHSTGKVRGFLCAACNSGLGCYEDDPNIMRAATAYLEAARDWGIGHRPLSLNESADCGTTGDGLASP